MTLYELLEIERSIYSQYVQLKESFGYHDITVDHWGALVGRRCRRCHRRQPSPLPKISPHGVSLSSAFANYLTDKIYILRLKITSASGATSSHFSCPPSAPALSYSSEQSLKTKLQKLCFLPQTNTVISIEFRHHSQNSARQSYCQL